jgi:hypothetical protein
MYKLVNNIFTGQPSSVEIYVSENKKLCIPFDPDNTDAQAFAKWLKDGGTPESAEDGGSVSAEWVAETIAKLLPNG